MHQVVVVDITQLSTSDKMYAESLLSEHEQGRYKRFAHASDAGLFLFGRYLTKYLVAQITGEALESIVIKTDGIAEKPYLLNSAVNFSISHSGSFVAVATSPQPVGIDVQIHDQTDLGLFHSFFTESEKLYLNVSPRHFYQLWTSVESLAKVTGLGFNESIRTRTSHIGRTLTGFTLHDQDYFVNTILDNKHMTLSVATRAPASFKNVPTVLPFPAKVYLSDGSTDSAV